jgi:hypothetical protein
VGVVFTTPDAANRDIFTATELLLVTGTDRDKIIIPALYIPTRYEGGADYDTVEVTLTEGPSLNTRLKNVDVEKIAVSELSGISASAFRWERADLLLRPAAGGVNGNVDGTTSGHSPSVSFGSISGKKTRS